MVTNNTDNFDNAPHHHHSKTASDASEKEQQQQQRDYFPFVVHASKGKQSASAVSGCNPEGTGSMHNSGDTLMMAEEGRDDHNKANHNRFPEEQEEGIRRHDRTHSFVAKEQEGEFPYGMYNAKVLWPLEYSSPAPVMKKKIRKKTLKKSKKKEQPKYPESIKIAPKNSRKNKKSGVAKATSRIGKRSHELSPTSFHKTRTGEEESIQENQKGLLKQEIKDGSKNDDKAATLWNKKTMNRESVEEIVDDTETSKRELANINNVAMKQHAKAKTMNVDDRRRETGNEMTSSSMATMEKAKCDDENKMKKTVAMKHNESKALKTDDAEACSKAMNFASLVEDVGKKTTTSQGDGNRNNHAKTKKLVVDVNCIIKTETMTTTMEKKAKDDDAEKKARANTTEAGATTKQRDADSIAGTAADDIIISLSSSPKTPTLKDNKSNEHAGNNSKKEETTPMTTQNTRKRTTSMEPKEFQTTAPTTTDEMDTTNEEMANFLKTSLQKLDKETEDSIQTAQKSVKLIQRIMRGKDSSSSNFSELGFMKCLEEIEQKKNSDYTELILSKAIRSNTTARSVPTTVDKKKKDLWNNLKDGEVTNENNTTTKKATSDCSAYPGIKVPGQNQKKNIVAAFTDAAMDDTLSPHVMKKVSRDNNTEKYKKETSRSDTKGARDKGDEALHAKAKTTNLEKNPKKEVDSSAIINKNTTSTPCILLEKTMPTKIDLSEREETTKTTTTTSTITKETRTIATQNVQQQMTETMTTSTALVSAPANNKPTTKLENNKEQEKEATEEAMTKEELLLSSNYGCDIFFCMDYNYLPTFFSNNKEPIMATTTTSMSNKNRDKRHKTSSTIKSILDPTYHRKEKGNKKTTSGTRTTKGETKTNSKEMRKKKTLVRRRFKVEQ